MKKSTNENPSQQKGHPSGRADDHGAPADATKNTDTNRTENKHQAAVSLKEDGNSCLPRRHHHSMISNHGQHYKRRNNISIKEGVGRSKPGPIAVSFATASMVPPDGNTEEVQRVLPGTTALHSYERRNNRGGKTKTSSTGNTVAEIDGDQHGHWKDDNRPGAIRVPGVNQETANEESSKSLLMQDNTGHSLETTKSIHGDSSQYLAEAFLVEESFREHPNPPPSQQQQQQQPTPLVEASPLVEEEKPWYTKIWFVIMLVGILILTIIIAVAVPLATKGGLSPTTTLSSNSPSVSPYPSPLPSRIPTFAPTMTVIITAVLRLDSSPSDTSWSIDCGQKNLFNIPNGTYDGLSNRTKTHTASVGVGNICTFIIEDVSQDGLEEGSFYRVFLGANYSVLDDPVPVPLVDGGGNFGSQANVSFEITSLPDEPTPSPSPQSPAAPPPRLTPPPTQITRASEAPTAAVFVYITIVIQFDELPSETGWSIFCNGVEERVITAYTYSVPSGTIADTFMVQSDSNCEFTIRDTFGDGICCAFGDGYYQVLFHEEENGVEEGNFVVLENRTGVNPFDVQSVQFVASSTGTNQ